MSWNHRIARRVFHGPTGTEEFLAVYEVYYDDKDKPNGITSNACAPGGETLDELRTELARMLAATGQPILDYDEIARGGSSSACRHRYGGEREECGLPMGHDGPHDCDDAKSDPLIRKEAARGRWPMTSPKWDDAPTVCATPKCGHDKRCHHGNGEWGCHLYGCDCTEFTSSDDSSSNHKETK